MNIQWNKIDLLSLDIFDTLLFRAVAKPIDIFPIIWKKAKQKQINGIDLSSNEFQKLRVEMERRVRNKHKNREVFLKEIYEEMPSFITNDKALLMQLELDTEKEYCYANPEICEVIKEAKENGKIIILTSDMYLTTKQIEEILEMNSISLLDIDDIIVSCEHKCNKQNGELYQKLFEKYPKITKEKILHIGDNRNSDYDQAVKKGLQAIYYDVVPDKMYSIYDYEKIRHNVPLPQLLSLRKLTATQKKGENLSAYEIGASILGPFLSLYISWVVDRLEALHINRIYPLMREGYLLGKLLDQEVKKRKLAIEIKPIYISRKVTYIPSIQKIDREEIENMIGARNLTIQEAIVLMGLSPINFSKFEPYFDVKLKEAHKQSFCELTLKEAFILEMLQPSCIKKIESYVRKQRQLLTTYLKQEIGDFTNVATIDIGFFGRIQMWMEQALHQEEIDAKMTHFLAIGVTGDKLFQGIHFEGYCSTITENSDLITTIHRTTDVLEKLISVTEGSTIGYQVNGITGRVEPIKGQAVSNIYLQDVFQGIYDYQKKWFQFEEKKEKLARDCVLNSREALMLIHRLIDLPRIEEARLFTTVEADTNFGTNYQKSIITKANIELLKEKGIQYIDKCNVSYTYENSNVVWPKGLITLEDEFYYVRKVLKEKSQNEITKSMQEVVERVQADDIHAVALYGAGENGRQFYFICRLYGIKVNCFIDRKESLWGTQKEGVEVMGLEEAMKRGNENFIVTSLFSISEIKDYILEKSKGRSNLRIFSV